MIILVNLDNLDYSIEKVENVANKLNISIRSVYYITSNKIAIYNKYLLIKLNKKDIYDRNKIRSKSFN